MRFLKTRHLLFLIVTCWMTSKSLAATYYVNCSASAVGADGSSSKPYPQLQTAIDRIINEGGTINVAAGVCRGSYSITNLSAPLTINGAGSSSTLFKGSYKLSGWTVHSNGVIYKLKTSSPVGHMFFNGQFLPKARYPTTGFLTIGNDAPTGLVSQQNLTLQASASDLALLKTKDLYNATLTARITDYWYNSVVVSNMNTTTGIMNMALTPSQNTECFPNCYFIYPPKKDWGYYLENKVWMMTEGSWVYDSSNQTAYVYLPGGVNPNSATVDFEVAYDKNIFTLTNSPNVTFQNFQIMNSGLSGVIANNSRELTIFQLEIKNMYRLAFSFDGGTQTWKMTKTIVNSTGSGVVTQYFTAESNARILIENNTFQNIATPLGPRFSAAAIQVSSYTPSRTFIRNNSFKNIGYTGIIGTAGSVLEGNTIENFCMITDDCGGIYVSDRYPVVTVRNNILRNATANLNGKARGAFPVAGIYLDDNSNGMSVTGNIIENVDQGIMLHNAHDNVIQNNHIYNYKTFGVRSVEDDVRKKFDRPSGSFVAVPNSSGQNIPSTFNNFFIGNTLASKYAAVPINVTTNQNSSMDRVSGAFKGVGNTFLNPTSVSYLRLDNPLGTRHFAFEELVSLGVDRSPFKTFDSTVSTFTTIQENATVIANTSANMLLFSIWSANRTLTQSQITCLLPSSSGICMSYGTVATETGLVISPPFAVAKDSIYRARIQVRSGNLKPSILSINVRENATPYANMDALGQQLFVEARTESGLWTNYDVYFKAKATSSNVRLDFTVPVSSTIIFGGFDVKNVNAVATDFNQYLQFHINSLFTSTAQISCPLSANLCEQWRDVEGYQAFYPFFLHPRSSVVLWRDPTQDVAQLESDLGMVKRIEFESVTTTKKDIGTNGTIRSANFDFASGGAGLLVLDKGDEISFTLPIAVAGSYHLSLRVRTGFYNANTSALTSYLETLNNYQVFVNDIPLQLVADLNSISGPDSKGGGVYWGQLYTPNLSLAAGNHTVKIRMNANWQMLDVLEILTADVQLPTDTLLVTVPTPDANPPAAITTTQKIELESVLGQTSTTLKDVGTNGAIRSAVFDMASGNAGLQVVDSGDEISFNVQIAATGSYHLSLRVRTGYYNATAYDAYSYLRTQNNYQIFVDNKAMQLAADLNDVVADSKGGGVYWGSLYTPNLYLPAGTHTVRIKVNSNWQMLDFLEIRPSNMVVPENLYIVTMP